MVLAAWIIIAVWLLGSFLPWAVQVAFVLGSLVVRVFVYGVLGIAALVTILCLLVFDRPGLKRAVGRP